MTLLRNIFSDLVEKRLWPLAVVLIAALFVAPAVLSKPATTDGSSADAVKAAPGSPAAKALAPQAAQVALNTTVPATGSDRGAVDHNPFVQQHIPKLNGPQGALQPPGEPGAADTVKSGGSDSAGTTTTTTKTTKGSSGKKHTSTTAVSVTLRFGEAGKLVTMKNISAYTPLPSRDEPFFVFLGLRKDDPKVAVFLVSSDAKATGDGVCRPDATTCDTIDLHVGDTEFFDLDGSGGAKQYQLDLVKVTR